MDVLQEISLARPAQNATPIIGADERESQDQGAILPYDATDASVPFPCSGAPGGHECPRSVPSPPSPLSLTEAPEHVVAHESSTHAISLTSCVAKGASPWSLPEDCDKGPFGIMEPVGVSTLTGDCLMQPSRTCLGCFIETKDGAPVDPEPEIGLKMEYDACSVSDVSLQCMSSGNSHYGDQLLADQLLGYAAHKAKVAEKREAEKSDSDSEDAPSKSIYEGLLLDRCNGEEGLLANPAQDWGCFESFISESKIELLDLCSKNDLSVNLFSEEDVDNYMFDDDDDSTLSSDVCSLKIRYESFQDNAREKTNALQEETQFNFFPSVPVNCAKKESVAGRKNVDGLQLKGEEDGLWGTEDLSLTEGVPNVGPESDYLFDSNNSTEDSSEYSDDSSCTGSSYDVSRENHGRNHFLSRENSSSSSQLNYGLRAKRKVRYSEDYLYDVDSLENERNAGKREKEVPVSLKEEEDDDWCPKKRRKSSRKEPPVVIKYIIINRFKGEKHMMVKVGKVDPADTTVSINENSLHKYERLAPLKHYWQKKQQERQEKHRPADVRHKIRLKTPPCRHAFRSSRPKRKFVIANRLRIQTVERSVSKQGSSSSDYRQEGHGKDGDATPASDRSSGHSIACAKSVAKSVTKSRSQEREAQLSGNKSVRIRKFKSEARLRSKKISEGRDEGCKSKVDLVCPTNSDQISSAGVEEASVELAGSRPQLCENIRVDPTETSTFLSTTCSSSKSRPAVNVATSVLVIPGGYLQTLLDPSDSSSGTGVPFFTQQPLSYPLAVSQEEKQLESLQLAQSCVLSPPSESELQQSPQGCTSHTESHFTTLWHSQPGTIPPGIPESPASGPTADSLSISGYGQLNLDEDRSLSEQSLQPGPAGDRHLQFQRGSLNTDDGRLVSFDSVGSLSAASSGYSCLSLKSCEKDSEDDITDNFLAHCSPKLVLQQSVDEIAPLKESTDLLDISNFTPDKFRHSSLSEMSPPDTPSLSPQVTSSDVKVGGKPCEFQVPGEVSAGDPQELQGGVLMADGHPFKFHTFSDEDEGVGLVEKTALIGHFDEQANQIGSGSRGSKAKKKNLNAGLGSAAEQRAARRTKGPNKTKAPRQSPRSSKKIKALSDLPAAKGTKMNNLIPQKQSASFGSSAEETLGGSKPESSALLYDDQREFEEPSNILSNIASGMAEVQRFMMASIEPLWTPTSEVCQPPEANSLKLKTLKILAGTAPDSKRKGPGGPSQGAGRGRKPMGKGGKNQAKFPLFSPLSLDCNMGLPGASGPAHKKMYRHKTSSKFPGDENSKTKRAGRDPSKDVALAPSFDKRR